MKLVAFLLATILAPFVAITMGFMLIPSVWRDMYDGLTWKREKAFNWKDEP